MIIAKLLGVATITFVLWVASALLGSYLFGKDSGLLIPLAVVGMWGGMWLGIQMLFKGGRNDSSSE